MGVKKGGGRLVELGIFLGTYGKQVTKRTLYMCHSYETPEV